MKRAALIAVVAVALIATLSAWALIRRDAPEPESTPATPAPTSTPKAPEASQLTAKKKPGCPTAVAKAFEPQTISVADVAKHIPVLDPPRDANDVPGIPPLTAEGKHVFAWDREQGVEPGDPRGNVLLNAHTWPDGSALGNQMLADLEEGDRIVVHGKSARLCYRVVEKVEVAAADGFPEYYDKDGPPRLAIIVCSGRRLGPGEWENRTIWFAAPRA